MSLHNYFKNWIPNLFSCANLSWNLSEHKSQGSNPHLHIYTFVFHVQAYTSFWSWKIAFSLNKLWFLFVFKKKKNLDFIWFLFLQSFWGEQINNSFKDNPRKNWELYEVPVIFNNLIVDCVTRAVSRSLRLVNF